MPNTGEHSIDTGGTPPLYETFHKQFSWNEGNYYQKQAGDGDWVLRESQLARMQARW